jgi:hypothetical protein
VLHFPYQLIRYSAIRSPVEHEAVKVRPVLN